MHEQNKHINPWAEKLQEITIPPLPESWEVMESLLDRELPIASRKNYKSWFLLLLLLLLLIGVCNYHGWVPKKVAVTQGRSFSESNHQLNPISENKTVIVSANKRNEAATKHVSRLDTINRSVTEAGIFKRKTSKQVNVQAGKLSKVFDTRLPINEDLVLNERQKALPQNERKIVAASHRTNISKKRAPSPENSIPSPGLTGDTNVETANHHHSIFKRNYPEKNQDINPMGSNNRENQDLQTVESNTFSPLGNRTTNKGGIQNVQKKQDSIKPERMFTGALNKQNNKGIKKQITIDSSVDYKGIVLAIGLNQFFPIGNEKKADFNSNGTSGTLMDYIPVPSIRYYFHQRLFVQAELQFNTPQYTQTLLADQQSKSNGSGQNILSSVFIKKLYYFNIPLSMEYSPVKNLYIGSGLQFSRLTNAVGIMQDSKINSSVPSNEVLPSNDSSLISTQIKSIKGDTVYQKMRTNEWRFLLDANYQWKGLTLGFRYNQAFTDFIHLKVSTTYLTEARNSSLQVYLKYVLWDHRKQFWHKQK